VTPRLPWLPPALRKHANGGEVTPASPTGRVAVVDTPPPARRPGTTATAWEHTRHTWEAVEGAVLDALAAAGGDLTAHRTVHLEDR
jgi:tRNA(Phe) wybutosine-synthesizing methylase Tyw3